MTLKITTVPLVLVMFTILCILPVAGVVIIPPSAFAQDNDSSFGEDLSSSILSNVLQDEGGDGSGSDASDNHASDTENAQDATNTATEDSNQGQDVNQDDISTFGDDTANLGGANVAVPLGIPIDIEEVIEEEQPPTTPTTPTPTPPTPPTPVEDTTPPILTVPEDITEEATSPNGAVVTFEVTAQDNVDGTATLEEDNTLTQDGVGGDITISCDPPSGSTFPIGETVVECTATDEAGNTATESFTVTVNPLFCGEEPATIYGTPGNDDLDGTEGRDVVVLLAGDDRIDASAGNDLICGDEGIDTMNGDAGEDEMFGGDGNDIMSGGAGNDDMNGGAGNDDMNGDAGNDIMNGGTGDDSMLGGPNNDNIVGNAGIDSANGGPNTDTCDAETEIACEA
jgi:Ca2+-binding RTX toxin-like protein